MKDLPYFKLPFLILLISILSINNCFSQKNNPEFKPKPAWVKTINFDSSLKFEDTGSYGYLLIDSQDNLEKQVSFRHFSIKILNSEGIQSISDLDISFDPTYQKLIIHNITIYRNGSSIGKIKDSNIRTIQRESDMNRAIYDGTLTTIINLKDVRVGDILDYSYSIQGFNPINNSNYTRTFYQQLNSEVLRNYVRILIDKKRKLSYKQFNNASSPEENEIKDLKEFTWDLPRVLPLIYDNNTPAWFNPQKRVVFTTFEKWSEVVHWALPLFNQDLSGSGSLDIDLNNSESKEDRILKIIRFVQDDIRYLGFENGIGAFKPHSPTKVLKQRFGDCKDKSLLLIKLLEKEGISAYPLLVNTYLKHTIANFLPSSNIFDHCVVMLEYKGQKIFVDPTISNQGGSLEHIYFPNYKYGLLIKNGTNQLLEIDQKAIPNLKILDELVLDSINGGATYKVTSTYSGNKADYIRDYFQTTSGQTIQKEYLNYYSNMYQNISSTGDVRIIDTLRNSTNLVTTIETYFIDKIWVSNNDNEEIYCEIYPLMLESLTEYSNTPKRTMPYHIGTLHSFEQTSKVSLPEYWPIEDEFENNSSSIADYSYRVKKNGDTVYITNKYELKEEYVSADETSNFLADNELNKGNYSYYLTYNAALAETNPNWTSIIIALAIIAIGFFLLKKLSIKFNPEPKSIEANLKIGGWLVLPAIGISLTPLILIFGLFQNGFFNQNIWAGAMEYENSFGAIVLIFSELIYNLTFLMFSVFVCIQFFQKRTSVPLLISIFYAVAFIFPLLDNILANIVVDEPITPDDISDLLRSLIAALIWIPYFNISKRVKKTFTHRYISN